MEREVISVLRRVEEYIDDRNLNRQPLRVALSGEWWWRGAERTLYASECDHSIEYEDLTIRWVHPTANWGETLELLLDDLHFYLREMRRADREKSKD